MLARAQIDMGANFVRAQMPGDTLMSQRQLGAIATVGAGTLTAAAMLNGIVERTGPTGNYIDTLDTADNLMAAAPNLAPGDSFEFMYRNTVAYTMTLAVAEGAALVGSHTAMIASNAREYLVQVYATARRQVYNAGTTNANPTITGLTAAQAQTLQPGMGVSGTGITGGTTVLAVNASTGSVTLSANATATGTAALTFFPRYGVKGLQTGAL